MHISKKNEVYLILSDLEPHESSELSSFFQFEVPGFKFIPTVRKRIWDGRIRLFSPLTKQIYVGLLPHLKKFLEKLQIKYTIEDGIENTRQINREDVEGFVKSLKVKSKGNPLEIRDYQYAAIHYALSNNRTLILSPTASGKSLVIYTLIRYYNLLATRSLIIVPTTSLVEQMYTDFEDYGWDCDTHCQKIYQGHERDISKNVVISTWQSVYKMPKKYFESFGCIIADEAHLCKAKSLISIMKKLEQCKYRFGFTGTLDGIDVHQLILEGLFGKVKNLITTKELMDSNTLANLDIKCIILKHKYNGTENHTYAEELQYLTGNTLRNKFISDLLIRLNGNTLCLFQLVEKHGKILYDIISKKITTNRKLFFVHGGVDSNQREEVRKITDENIPGIKLHFGDKSILVDKDEKIPLTNSSVKLAKEITYEDDIDDSWIYKKLKEKWQDPEFREKILATRKKGKNETK